MTEIDRLREGVQQVRTHTVAGGAKLPNAAEELGKADGAAVRFIYHLGALLSARKDFIEATDAAGSILSGATGEIEEAKTAAQASGLADTSIDSDVARSIIECIDKMKSNVDNVRALTVAAASYFAEQTSSLDGLQELAQETEDHIAAVARPEGDVGHSLPVAFFMGQTVTGVTDNYLMQF